MAAETFVIVGAGLAGAKAAETLRYEGFDGRLILIGDEPERPYERPPLSKDYLRGESAERPYVHPESFYTDTEIELWTSTRVSAVNASLRELWLEGDQPLIYDRLLVATGAVPRRLEVPGAELGGIHYLRSLADSERIGERIERGGHLVVVGSGWIGAEVAASARQKGCEVTMLERASLPLEPVLGPELGQIYVDLHRGHGVEFLPETTVARFDGHGSVERVLTEDGNVIEADFVVVGIGAAPRAGLLETARDPGRQRRRRRRAPRGQRPGRLCRRRPRQRLPSLLRSPPAGRALGQRAQAGTDRRPVDARQAGYLRRDPLLLLRPVRGQHGVRRLRHRLG